MTSAATTPPINTTIGQGLYKEARNQYCTELDLGSKNIMIIATMFTLFFFILVPFFARGATSSFALVATILLYAWYIFCVSVYSQREFYYWSELPSGFQTDCRCWLSRELSERLVFKCVVVQFLFTKLFACLAARNYSTESLQALRHLNKFVVTVGGIAAIPRSFASVVSVFLFQWPMCYAWLLAFLGLYCSTRVSFSAHNLFLNILIELRIDPKNDEKKNNAIEGLQAIEVLMGGSEKNKSAEDPSSSTGPRSGEQLSRDLEDPVAIDMHARLFDSLLLLQKAVFVVSNTVAVYFAVVAFDYQFSNLGILYGDAFTTNIETRPSWEIIKSKFSQMDSFDQVYVVSLFS